MYKLYPNIGICITKSIDGTRYVLTDYNTGYYAGRSFKKLTDAKRFIEVHSIERDRFIEALNTARKTLKYGLLKIVNERGIK